MIGLIYIVFFAVYFLLSFIVVRWAYSFSHRRFNQGRTAALLAGFVMYNLVFWDWIPVWVAHKYYCATEAGFWVYKSPEQWIQENPDKLGEAWHGKKTISETIDRHTRRYWYSPSIYTDVRQDTFFLNAIVKTDERLIDKHNGGVLAHAVEYSRGYQISPANFKFWLKAGNRFCGPSNKPSGFDSQFGDLAQKLAGP